MLPVSHIYTGHLGILGIFLVCVSLTTAHLASSRSQPSRRELTLPILESSETRTATNLTTSLSVHPKCVAQPRDPRAPPRYLPVNVPDCALVLYNILSSPSANIPMPWHEVAPESPNYIRRWSWATCNIALSSLKPGSRDAFAETLIARQAALVMKACLTPRSGYLGGFMLVGPMGEYAVAVRGQPPGPMGVA